jgi:hypothetical protein
MTVSATATQDFTVDEIIATAMATVGVLNPAHINLVATMHAAELEMGRRWLYFYLQALPNSGLILRARERVTAALTASVAYVDAAADTLSIEKNMVIRDSLGVDRGLLDVINEEQYQAISNKTQEGSPTQVYVEKLITGVWRLHTWPVHDGAEARSLIYSRTRRLRDVEPGSVTLDLDPKHYKHVLAHLCARFGGSKGRKDSQAMFNEENGVERTIAENDETPRGDLTFALPDLDLW